MNVRTKPFYVHENQCTQIRNLSSPGEDIWDFLFTVTLKLIRNKNTSFNKLKVSKRVNKRVYSLENNRCIVLLRLGEVPNRANLSWEKTKFGKWGRQIWSINWG